MQKTKLFQILIICMTLLGCASNKSVKQSEIEVVGDKIYYNHKLFAELRLLDLFNNEGSGAHQGVAIYYYQSGREEWIFPSEGWSVRLVNTGEEYSSVEEIRKIYSDYFLERHLWGIVDHLRGDFDLLLGGRQPKLRPVCFDVKISKDGKYVYYKSHGIFFNSSHKFRIDYSQVR